MNANNEKASKAISTTKLVEQSLTGTHSIAELSITIKNGVATLSGATPTTEESNLAESLVARMDGVEQVINLISSNKAYSL